MIRIKCPKCQQILSLDDALAGTICSCDQCGQRFKAPQPKATAATKKPAAPVNKPAAKPWQEGDDFSPYAVIQPEESDTRVKDDDRIDQMVKDSFRQKKRQKAWDKVGMPAMLLKLFSLIGIGSCLLTFILCSIDCVLYIFKVQQHYDNPGKPQEYPLPTMFLFDFFGSRTGDAPAEWIWAIAFGILLVMFALYGIAISGAENLRSLNSYTRAMIGSIVGIFVAGPAGILALFAVLDEDVKLQFAPYKKELNRREEREWDDMQEQIQEELEAREDAEREGRTYRPHKRIKAQREAEAKQQTQSALVMAIGGIAFLIVLCVITYFLPLMVYGLYFIGAIFLLIGFVMLLIAAFRVDAIQGILVLVVPFYYIYFWITNWQESKASFFAALAGFLFLFAGTVMVIIVTAGAGAGG